MCWGDNDFGQLGDGTTTLRDSATFVNGVVVNTTAFALGRNHSCAVRADGTVRCWGANGAGQLGNGGTAIAQTAITQVSGLTGVLAVAAGGLHTCALRFDGTVRCWGSNAAGQLGDGTTVTRVTSVQVSGLTNVTAIAAGAAHTCAVRSDGTGRCWGDNASGQIGNGNTTDRTSPVQVSGLTSAVTMVAGQLHTCALRAEARSAAGARTASASSGTAAPPTG